MKQTATTVVIFFLLLFAYTKFAGPIPFSVTSVTTQKTDAFTVTGEVKTTVVPDMAMVTVGVVAQGSSVKEAQRELNTKINAVSAAIKKLGVGEKDIQTSNYSIYPNYDFRPNGQRLAGYQASSNLTIKIREIDNANGVIDAATANGANQIGGVTFDVDDKSKAENEAREKAVAQARKKAEDAAKIAGFTLGRIVNYSEDFGGQIRPLPLTAKAETGEPDAVTQVEPGTNEVVVNVSLSFEIR